MTRRALLLCQDRIGPKMAGPAIRYAEFARGLAERGWQVTVLLGQPVEDGYELPGVELVSRDVVSWRVVRELAARADVVLTQPQRVHLAHALHRAGTPVVYDLYAPLVVEQLGSQAAETEVPLARRSLVVEKFAMEERVALEGGTAFLCASPLQRDFWLGALSARGRLTLPGYVADAGFEHLVSVVPFGLPDGAPVRTAPTIRGVLPGVGADDLVLLWAGGIWNWLDPLTIIAAVGEVAHVEPRVKLVFLGAQHPNDDVKFRMTEDAIGLARDRGLLDRNVFFNEGWVPYDERGGWLLDADLGVSAHHATLETRLSFRQRIVDHVWAGLPTLATRGDMLGEWVADAGAGRLLGDGAVGAWASALLDLAGDRGEVARMREALPALQAELRWSRIVDGLDDVLGRVADGGAGTTPSPVRALPKYVGVQARLQGGGTALSKIGRSLRRR